MSTDTPTPPYDNGGVLAPYLPFGLALDKCVMQPENGSEYWVCLRADRKHLEAAHGGEAK